MIQSTDHTRKTSFRLTDSACHMLWWLTITLGEEARTQTLERLIRDEARRRGYFERHTEPTTGLGEEG